MKDNLKMLGVMTIFCLVAGLLLAWTYNITKGPIDKAKQEETMGALKLVLPECDNDVVADARVVVDGGRSNTFYVAKKQNVVVGVAFKETADGYGGPIELMVGLLADGAVNGVQVMQAEKETPGLGSKVREATFRDRFKGKSARDTRWAAVQKDGGEIVAITGATISSRAVAKAVKAGLDVYAKHTAEIQGQPNR